MPKLRINNFHGLAPKYNRRQLPPGRAQIAQDVRFDSDEIRPLRASRRVQLFANVDAGSLFVYQLGGETVYMPFGQSLDVDLVDGPVASDAFERTYWTTAGQPMRAINTPPNPAPSGFNTPIGGASNFRPFGGYEVGVQPPNNAPSAANTTADKNVGAGTFLSILSMSSENPAKITLSGEPPFDNGDRVKFIVSGFLAMPVEPGEGDDGAVVGPVLPPDPEQDTETIPDADLQVWNFDGQEYVVQNVSEENFTFELFGLDTSGYGAFPSGDLGNVNITQVVDDNDLNSISYAYTYVTVHGEEGPPSAPSAFIDRLDDGTARVNISEDAWDGVGEPDLVNRIRLYRTVTGTTGTNFQFLGTLPFGAGASEDSDGLTWVTPPNQVSPALAWSGVISDAVPPVELGEIIPSEGWYPPPDGLAGLTLMPNGYLVGFKGRELHFSEPYLPHAWNPDNIKVTDEEIIGIAATGNVLTVGTRGRPVIGSGTDPSSFTLKRAELHAPLFHKRAMINVGAAVAYPSTDGLVMLSGSGSQYLTQRQYDKKTWLTAIADRPNAVFHDNRYMLYGRGQSTLMLDINDSNDGLEVSEVSEQFDAAAIQDDELLIVGQESEWRDLRVFNDPAGTRLTGIWESGLYTLPSPVNFAVGQVFSDAYPVTMTIKYVDPARFGIDTVNQYDLDDSDLREDVYTVTGEEPFRMRDGFLSREYIVRVDTPGRIQQINLATSMGELRDQS